MKFFTILAALLFSTGSLFSLELRLREELIAGPGTTIRGLFANGGMVQGKSFATPLDLSPGYHYLSQGEVREILVEQMPGLAKTQGGLVIVGEGIRVFVQNALAANPLKNTPAPFPEPEASVEVPENEPGSRFFVVFAPEWSGRGLIPRGTSVLLRRETDRLSLELRGVLVRDWDLRSRIKIKLFHSDKVLEETVGKGQILFL